MSSTRYEKARMAADPMDDWEALLDFLNDPRPEVRKIAAQNVRGYSQSGPHLDFVENRKPEGVKSLCNLIGDDPIIAGDAVQSLINMMARDPLAALMLQYNVIDRVMGTLGSEATPLMELKLILLSNLTGANEDAIARLLQLHDEDIKGVHIARLLGWFLQGFRARDRTADSLRHLRWVMPILANVSSHSVGQMILLDETPVVPALPDVLGSLDPLTRAGGARLAKNLAMIFPQHEKLVAAGLPTALLHRLDPATELQKEVRRLAAEALVLLSRSPAGVEYFDGHGGKAALSAAAAAEPLEDVRGLLQAAAAGLEDVQDAFVVTEPPAPPSAALLAAAKTPEEADLELPE